MKLLVPVLLLFPAIAYALPPDVSESDWFAEAVSELVDMGYIDESQEIHPSDLATRSAFIQLMVDLKGGANDIVVTDENESFKDVSYWHDYAPHFEKAAQQGWMKGVGNCYGTEYCNANPNGLINRAEAAALLSRAFGLDGGEAPEFDDNSPGEWFTEHINVAASSCILKGDGGSKKVRPADNMNRAEMFVMLYRLHAGLRYPNCNVPIARGLLPRAPIKQVNREEGEYCDESAWVCDEWSECANGGQNRFCRQVQWDCLSPEDVQPKNYQKCTAQEPVDPFYDPRASCASCSDYPFRRLSCSEWDPCDFTGYQSRTCIYGYEKKNSIKTYDVEEVELKECEYEPLSMDHWANLRVEFENKAKEIAEYNEGAAQTYGLSQLHEIESRYVTRYNQLIKYGCITYPQGDNCELTIMYLEGIEKELNELPVFFY